MSICQWWVLFNAHMAFFGPGNLYGDSFIRNDKDPGDLVNQNFSLFMLH